MHYTYILQSQKDSSHYVGSTHDLKLRVEKHNNGEVIYSAKKAPMEISLVLRVYNQKASY